MKETELRIGNIVSHPTTNGTINPHIITFSDFCYEYNSSINLSSFNPIPLTEEWLVMFGFDLETYKGIGCIDSPNDMFHSLQRIGDCFYPYETDNVIPVKLQYVHQLQNLYFAMTGEELTIK